MILERYFQVFEYNDVDDKANLDDISDNSTFWRIHDLSQMTWANFSIDSNPNTHKITLKVDENNSAISFRENGSLSFVVRALMYVYKALLLYTCIIDKKDESLKSVAQIALPDLDLQYAYQSSLLYIYYKPLTSCNFTLPILPAHTIWPLG